MSIDVLDRRGVKHQIIYEISGTIPEAFAIYLSSSGGGYVDTSEYIQYQPIVIDDGDLVQDDAGFIRGSITLMAQSPIAVIGPDVSCTGFSDLRRKYQLEHATIAVYHQGELQDGTLQQNQRLLGEIVRISNVSVMTATLEIEQRAEVGRKFVPQKMMTKDHFLAAYASELPQRSKDEAFPLNFGRAYTYAPSSLYPGISDDAITGKLNRCGIKPRGFPSRPIRETTSETWHLWTEKIDGGLIVETDGLGTADRYAHIYFSQVDAYGRPYSARHTMTQDGTRGWVCKLPRSPILRIPLLCDKVNSSVSTVDPELAIDGRAETFAAIYPNGNATWDLPSVSALGRIIKNTNDEGGSANDFEGALMPAGILVFALIVQPQGSTVPVGTSDTAVWMVFPSDFTNNNLFGNKAVLTLPTAVGDVQVSRSYIRVAGTAGQIGDVNTGWYATKFDRWDLSAAKYSDAGNDKPLTHSDNGDNTGPFRVKIANTTSNSVPIYVASVGVEIGFEFAKRGVEPWIEEGPAPFGYPFPIRGKEGWFAFPGGRTEPDRRWSRGRTRGRRLSREYESIDNVYISGESYQDDDSDTYYGTGTNWTLFTWSLYAHYLLKIYGVQTSIITSANSHGGFYGARNALDYWATMANGGVAKGFHSMASIMSRSDLDSVIRDFASNFPGSAIVRDRQGQWGCHIWAPRSEQGSGTTYRNAVPYVDLDPDEALVMGNEGPQFTTDGGDLGAVVNQIVVNYDRDPGSGRYDRKATLLWVETAGAFKSDDGYGSPWAPFEGGVAVEDLAQYSADHFGMTTELEINLPEVIERESAVAVGLYHLARFWRPPSTIRFEGRPCFHDLETYQLLKWSDTLESKYSLALPWNGEQDDADGGLWSRNWWRVMHVEVQNNPEKTYLIEAEWIPSQYIGGPLQGGRGGEITPDFEVIDLGPLA